MAWPVGQIALYGSSHIPRIEPEASVCPLETYEITGIEALILSVEVEQLKPINIILTRAESLQKQIGEA